MVENNVSAVYHYQLSIFYFSFHKLIKNLRIHRISARIIRPFSISDTGYEVIEKADNPNTKIRACEKCYDLFFVQNNLL